jgi:quercetin dioxygenase-like cupin family protein
MIIQRWQAKLLPTPEQARGIFLAEELRPWEETLNPGEQIGDHRHPFDEIRMVVAGELLLNIAGNQVLLRTGDKIMIPSNTRHSKSVHGEQPCVCLVAHRPF